MLFVPMTIADWLERGKEALQGIPREKRLAAAILGASTLAFGLGIASSKDWSISEVPAMHAAAAMPEAGQGAWQKATDAQAATSTKKSVAPTTAAPATTGKYVASKSGSKFYLPSCAGAKRIRDENKVWFETEAAAEAAGYSPAANCKGL